MPLSSLSPFITADQLLSRLGAPDLLLFDCRYDLRDPEAGRAQYAQSHLPGARFLDLDLDLSGPKGLHGGRHPLPDPAVLGKTLSSLGLTENTQVVAYDNDGTGSARLWWLLQYYGHQRAQILEDGFAGWMARQLPVTREFPNIRPGGFVPRPDPAMVVDVRAVADRDPGVVLIDVRAAARYRGETEPLDPVAGHIPGARNLDWLQLMAGTARWKSPADAAPVLDTANTPLDPWVYCGSGVSACAAIVGMVQTGRRPRLYAGSWSDWISYPDNPIATGPGR